MASTTIASHWLSRKMNYAATAQTLSPKVILRGNRYLHEMSIKAISRGSRGDEPVLLHRNFLDTGLYFYSVLKEGTNQVISNGKFIVQ